MKYYYLFGYEISEKFNQDGLTDDLLKEMKISGDYALKTFDPTTDNPQQLLDTYDGWGGYVILSEEEYDKIVKNENLPEQQTVHTVTSRLDDALNFLHSQGFTVESGTIPLTYDVFKKGYEDSTMHYVTCDELVAYANELKTGLPPQTISPQEDIPDLRFPNDFSSWQETHFEIVQAITIEMAKDEPEGKAAEKHEAKGHGGLYELAEELTNKFEEKYRGEQWGETAEYFDTIEEFLKEELYPKEAE